MLCQFKMVSSFKSHISSMLCGHLYYEAVHMGSSKVRWQIQKIFWKGVLDSSRQKIRLLPTIPFLSLRVHTVFKCVLLSFSLVNKLFRGRYKGCIGFHGNFLYFLEVVTNRVLHMQCVNVIFSCTWCVHSCSAEDCYWVRCTKYPSCL